MSINEQDDKHFERYLEGDSEISKRYSEASQQQPPAAIDMAILSAAKDASVSDHHRRQPFWLKPLSIAASIALCVSLVISMQQETGQTVMRKHELESFNAAPVKKQLPSAKIEQLSPDVVKDEPSDVISAAKPSMEMMSDSVVPTMLDSFSEIQSTESFDSVQEQQVLQSRVGQKLNQESMEKRLGRKVVELNTPEVKMRRDMEAESAALISDEKQVWLTIISLYENGKLEEANRLLNQLRSNYPDYSVEMIKSRLGSKVYDSIIKQQ